MAHRVVDELEVVNVDQDQRHRVRVACRASTGTGCGFEEPAPVRRRGERVLHRLLLQRALDQAPLGHVAHVDHHAADGLVVSVVGRADLRVAHRPVRPEHPQRLRDRPIAVRCAGAIEHLEGRVEIVGVHAVPHRKSGGCGHRPAEDPARRRAGVGHLAFGADHEDRVRGVLDERAEPPFASLQREPHPLALGHVLHAIDDQGVTALPIVQRRVGREPPALLDHPPRIRLDGDVVTLRRHHMRLAGTQHVLERSAQIS